MILGAGMATKLMTDYFLDKCKYHVIMLRNSILSIVLVLLINCSLIAQSQYKVTLFRATPGYLSNLIGALKTRAKDYVLYAGKKPYIIRHSQGDHWDLMVIEYINSYLVYYEHDEALSEVFSPDYGSAFYNMIAHHENWFVHGPPYAEVAQLFKENNFFHVEMFIALPGKQKELLEERKMENIFLAELVRPENLIFMADQGSNWDLFTLGGYRDLKHFAESSDIPEEDEEIAAQAAGFKGVKDISFYLRSLIALHHDTLASKVE